MGSTPVWGGGGGVGTWILFTEYACVTEQKIHLSTTTFLCAHLKKAMRFKTADQYKRGLTVGAPFGKCGQFAV